MVEPKITFKVSRKGKLNNYQMEQYFKELSRQALANKLSKGVFATANKRIKRLEASGFTSQALESLHGKGYQKFTTAGKDLKELWKDYSMCINFLNMKTSSITGVKQQRKNMESRIGRKMTEKQAKKVFSVVRELQKSSPRGIQLYGSDRLIQLVYDEYEEIEWEELGGEDFETMVDIAWKEVSKEVEKAEIEFNNRVKDSFTI